MNGPRQTESAARLVAIGTSWGGLEALGRLLGELPPNFRTPVVVVQHRGPTTPEGAMRRYLAQRCGLEVIEADDKEPIAPGRVYLAPPDYHLLVEEGFVALSLEAPVGFSRPSVDVLFETAAEAYGSGVVAVVLTGANSDGSRGILSVRSAGGTVLVQDPTDAERPEMPAAALATGVVDEVHPIARLAQRLVQLDRGD